MTLRAPKGVRPESWAAALAGDAPVILTIHGTFDGEAADIGTRWWQQQSIFQQQIGERLQVEGTPPLVLPFHWTGQNSDFDRQQAARNLRGAMNALNRTRKRYAILGHSHAGNAIYSAFRHFGSIGLGDMDPLPSAVITYGTPYLRRSRTLLNRLMLAANIGALIYALPLVAMMLLAAPSIFGLFGNPAIGKIGLLSIQMLVGLAIPFCLVTIYVSWRYGLAYIASSIGFRRRRAALGMRWLNLRSPFDEVITVLPKFVAGKYRVITDVAARRAVTRTIVGAASVFIAALMGTLLAFGFAYVSGSESTASNYNIFVRYSIPMLYFIFASNMYIVVYLIAVAISPILGTIYGFLLNDTVRRALKNSAYGEDHDYHLKEILPTPPQMTVVDHVVNSSELGGVTPERRQQASSALLDFIVGSQAAEALATDPTEVWRDLNAALFHNAYFEDAEVVEATVAHLGVHFASANAAEPGLT